MKLGFELKIEQSQKLIMTADLRQAIELLQFNTTELNQYINTELEENPMLDMMSNREKETSLEEHKETDVDWAEYFENSNNSGYKPERDRNLKGTNYEAFIKKEETLDEFLLKQLNLLCLDEKEKEIGKILIRSLDESGYLDLDLDFLSKKIKIKIDKIEKVLLKIQKFDPPGIGARNLKECLLIQIDHLKKEKPYLEIIIDEYLEDLAHNRIEKISKALKIKSSEVRKALEIIKKLEPKPGRYLYNGWEDVQIITPDAEIVLVEGKYEVVLNDVTGPRLNINNFYKNMMQNKNDEKTEEYLTERFNRALWVIRSIEQRRNTIKKLLESIIKYQKDFFEKGEKYIKPLTMKQVADDIEMHESTVSRASNGKYIQTPRGLYEIKYFFTSGLDGEISSTSIKSIIKDLVDNENKKKPYSDQKISELLRERGINISRRTVSKYRDEINILSSSLRRR